MYNKKIDKRNYQMRLSPKPIFILLLFFMGLITGCSNSSDSLPGYIEGEYTYIASGVAGTLFHLYVARGEQVKKGAALYALDLEPESAMVTAAEANISDVQAQVDFAKVHYEREKLLYPHSAASKEDLDQAQQIFTSRSQNLANDKALLAQNQWSLNQKTPIAPADGMIFDTYYRVGEKVEANHPVLAMLTPNNIRVLFYVPQAILSQLKIGQDIAFSCDGCQGKTTVKISYISPEAEYTPPVIYSKDTRDKLVYLIRANIPENIANQFHPGQPIDVYLHHE
jgi:HlyD family secretion protein